MMKAGENLALENFRPIESCTILAPLSSVANYDADKEGEAERQK